MGANGLLTNSITHMLARILLGQCVLFRGPGGHYHAIQGYNSGSCGIYLAEDMIEVLEVMKMNSYFRLNYLNTTTFTGAGILPVCTTFPKSAPDMTSTIFFLFSSSFSVRSNSVVVRLNVWKSSSSAPAVCPVPRSAAGSVTTRK